MSFDWKYYLDLASELIKFENPSLREACDRTSVSRSYYAVFGIAKKWLIEKGESIPFEDSHKFVREKFIASPKRVEKRIGGDLGKLWLERKDADYEESPCFDNSRARTFHLMASRVLPLVQKGLEDVLAAKKSQPSG